MSRLFRFGEFICSFEDYRVRGLFDSWRWRLDPYASGSAAPDIMIQSDTQERLPAFQDGQRLLQDDIAGFFHRQVLSAPDGGVIWQLIRSKDQTVYLQYYISPDWKQISLLADRTETAGQMAFESLGQILPSAMLRHEILTFHGVLMEHEGRGIIISANSGMGKTTHARLWRDHRQALIINGDRAACHRVDGVWTGFGLPWSGSSGEQINRSVPIKALVILERGEQNEAHRVTGLEAFGAAWIHVQRPHWDAPLSEKALELTDAFLSDIPVIRLHCRPDEEAVEVLHSALEEL